MTSHGVYPFRGFPLGFLLQPISRLAASTAEVLHGKDSWPLKTKEKPPPEGDGRLTPLISQRIFLLPLEQSLSSQKISSSGIFNTHLKLFSLTK